MDFVSVRSTGPSFIAWIAAAAVILLLLVPSWLLLARSRFINAEGVERPGRVPQLYGYTVCLVALITALASAHNVVEGAMGLSNPLAQAANENFSGFEPSLTTFEAYRATHTRSRMGPGGPAYGPLPSEDDLRRQYEGLKAERIAAVTFRSWRDVVTGGTMLIIAVTLFALHWRWLRGQRTAAAVTA